jgi:hypothetical protein
VILKPGDIVKVNNVASTPVIKVRAERYCDIDPRVKTTDFDVTESEVGIVLALVDCPISNCPETLVMFGTRYGWTWDNCWKRC